MTALEVQGKDSAHEQAANPSQKLADGLKHGQDLAASSTNGTLVRVGHVGHHIHSLRLRQGQLRGQAQGFVALPDACADGLQHPALGLHRGRHDFDPFSKAGKGYHIGMQEKGWTHRFLMENL
ncbi:MAG: hypothetical protein FRX49_05987 [Trebouxia sp. A1-2]|nr:MAG: hypothetical protein FRX49_05987 [Trebouxia sp. A1-2]